jgi:hypothetical protein
MKDLERALADIAEIRTQVARGSEFRGYGPMTVAATAVLAIAAGIAQGAWLPKAEAEIVSYLVLWIATAIVCVILVGTEMVARTRRMHSGIADEMIHAATEQLIPAGVAGALLTFILFRSAPQSLWMLPGLWQIIFSLGFIASCRSLPKPMFAVGVWYLASGLACVTYANGEHALSPWAMALPFAVGQLAMAAILYWGVGDNRIEDGDGEQ